MKSESNQMRLTIYYQINMLVLKTVIKGKSAKVFNQYIDKIFWH